VAVFYQCYANTYYERGQQPYLNIEFFKQLGRSIPENLMLIVAEQRDEPVAAALFFKDDKTLYGRYWGAVRAIDCLHFEVCYYQGIEYAITQQLQFFDPGTQGEHKLIRGFAPVFTHSVHWLARTDFRPAIQHFCAEEKKYIAEYYQAALNSTPFKQTDQ
jgi:predicted N-acyltransferase